MLNILHTDNAAQLTCIAQIDEANKECSAAINILLTNKKPTNLTFLESHALMQHHLNSVYLAAIKHKLHYVL
jgi:hypothetical protein